MKRGLAVLAGIGLSVVVIGCGGAETASPSATTAPPTSFGTPLQVVTVSPTRSPIPADTPATALPTETPFPMASFPTPTNLLPGAGLLPDGVLARIPPSRLQPDVLRTAVGRYYVTGRGQAIEVYAVDSGALVWAVWTAEEAHPTISPDGMWVIANVRGTIYAWDVVSGSLHAVLAPTGRAVLFRWSPDGKWLAVVFVGYGIVMWDPAADEIVYTITDQKTEIGHILWTRDGSLLITANYAHGQVNNEIVVREATTGTALHRLVQAGGGLEFSIANLYLSPDESMLAATYGHFGGDTSSGPGLAVLWDVQTGERLHELEYPTLWDVTFSPDGRYLALSNKTVYPVAARAVPVWDTQTGALVYELVPPYELEHDEAVTDAQWSPDGTMLATVIGGRIALWDAAIGEHLRTLVGPEVHSITWSEDSRRISGGASTWDAATGTLLETLSLAEPPSPGRVLNVAWTQNGTGLVADGTLWDIGDVRNPRQLASLPLEHSLDFVSGEVFSVLGDPPYYQILRRVRSSPDGERVAAAFDISDSHNGTGVVAIWSFATSGLEKLLYVGEGGVRDAVWSPDGSALATCSSGVAIWDIQTGDPLVNIEGECYTAAWSPDGARIALARESSIGVYEVESRTLVTDLDFAPYAPRDDDYVSALAWSPDGERLAAGGSRTDDSTLYPGIIALFEVGSGVAESVLIGHGESITAIAWSPDGRQIATAGGAAVLEFFTLGYDDDWTTGSLALWDAQDGRLLRLLVGQTYGIEDVAFSPDGSWLASASLDGTVLIWDVP